MSIRFWGTYSDATVQTWESRARSAAFCFLGLVLFALAGHIAPRVFTGQVEGRIDRVQSAYCNFKSTKSGCWMVHFTDRSGERTSFGLSRHASAPAVPSLKAGDPIQISYVLHPPNMLFETRWPLEIRSGTRTLYDRATSWRELSAILNRFTIAMGVLLLVGPLGILLWGRNRSVL